MTDWQNPDWQKDWDALVAVLPPRHRLLVTGPHGDDKHWSLAVVLTTTPNRQVFGSVGPMNLAIQDAMRKLDVYVRLDLRPRDIDNT